MSTVPLASSKICLSDAEHGLDRHTFSQRNFWEELLPWIWKSASVKLSYFENPIDYFRLDFLNVHKNFFNIIGSSTEHQVRQQLCLFFLSFMLNFFTNSAITG